MHMLRDSIRTYSTAGLKEVVVETSRFEVAGIISNKAERDKHQISFIGVNPIGGHAHHSAPSQENVNSEEAQNEVPDHTVNYILYI